MDNQEAIRLIRNLPTMCGFTDAYGEPIDSDAYYEAVDMAISALKAQEAKHSNESSSTQKALDTISRHAAIDALIKADYEFTGILSEPRARRFEQTINALPPAQPEIIRCKECAKREICRTSSVWAVAPHDDWYCADAERRTDERTN